MAHYKRKKTKVSHIRPDKFNQRYYMWEIPSEGNLKGNHKLRYPHQLMQIKRADAFDELDLDDWLPGVDDDPVVFNFIEEDCTQ